MKARIVVESHHVDDFLELKFFLFSLKKFYTKKRETSIACKTIKYDVR